MYDLLVGFYQNGKPIPVSYTHLDVYKRQGDRLPKGDFVTVNACSSLRGKNTGWCIWCVAGAHEKYKLIFEPSQELVEKLLAAFPEQSLSEPCGQPAPPAE